MMVVHSVLHSRNTLPIVTSHAFNSAPPAAMLCGCVTFSYCVLTQNGENSGVCTGAAPLQFGTSLMMSETSAHLTTLTIPS